MTWFTAVGVSLCLDPRGATAGAVLPRNQDSQSQLVGWLAMSVILESYGLTFEFRWATLNDRGLRLDDRRMPRGRRGSTMGGTDGGVAHIRLLANLMQPAASFCSEAGLRDVDVPAMMTRESRSFGMHRWIFLQI